MAPKMQHCFNCGEECGVFDNHWRDLVTCGKRECEREARYQYQCEEADARERAESDNYDRYR